MFARDPGFSNRKYLMGASLSCVRWAGRAEAGLLRAAPLEDALPGGRLRRASPESLGGFADRDALLLRRASRDGLPEGFEDASALLMELPEVCRSPGRVLLIRSGSALRAELKQASELLSEQGPADIVIRELLLGGARPALLPAIALLLHHGLLNLSGMTERRSRDSGCWLPARCGLIHAMAIEPFQAGGDTAERATLFDRFMVLASAGVSLDALSQGETPLMWAIRKGPLDAVKALLEAGADVFAQSRDGLVALHVAADCGRAEAVPELLARMSECPDFERHGGRNICVGQGAKLGWSALHLAAARGDEAHAEVIRLLAAYPGGMNDRNPSGDSALMLATRADSACAVHALLEQAHESGAAVDLKHGPTGRTALHAACELGMLRSGVALLECGADQDARMSDGSRPLHLVARLHPGMPVPRRDLAAALINFNSDVNPKNKKGYTPLDIARNGGNDQVCLLLKARGAEGDCHAFTPYNP